MQHCPNCNKQYESGKFCPECGVPLVEDQSQQATGVSVNLGDANAISGGVHVSNTTNIQTTYIHEREKSENELEQEKRIKFMSLCEKVFEDGILENYEIVQLEDERIKLGLDKETANMMIEQARKSCISTKATLAARDAITMKIINMQIQKNDIVQIKAQFPKLEAIHDIYKNDALDCTYFMLLSTLFPDKFIETYENSQVDDYWQTFWGVIAYLKAGEMDKAEKALAKLSWFTRYPESNDLLLSALNSNMEFGPDIAKDYLSIVEAEPCSPELTQFYHALLFEIDPEKAASFGINDNNIAYYLKTIVRMEDPRKMAAIKEKEKAEKEEKIRQLGETFLQIIGEYSISGNKMAKDQVEAVKDGLLRYQSLIEKEKGEDCPEWKEAEEAYWALRNANASNLWEARNRVNGNEFVLKRIDDALKNFVESEMTPSRIEERKEQKRKEDQQLESIKEMKKRYTETKVARDKRAPLLGEAFNLIKELMFLEASQDEKERKRAEIFFSNQGINISNHYFGLSEKVKFVKELKEEYDDIMSDIRRAHTSGKFDLWTLRKVARNVIFEGEMDNALESFIEQECSKNAELMQWFKIKEKGLEPAEDELKAQRDEMAQIEARKKVLELAEIKLKAHREEKERIRVKEKQEAENRSNTTFYFTRRINVDDLSDAERDFMKLVKIVKSRLAAKVTANPEDKEAENAYERVKYAYKIFHDSSFDNKRNVATLREMLKDCPLAIEAIEQCAPRFK